MEKCSHCGALLGGTVELTSKHADSTHQFLYAQGEVAYSGESVFGEEIIISLIDLRSAELHYTGSRRESRLILTYKNDNDKIYLQGPAAENLFDQLRQRRDREVS